MDVELIHGRAEEFKNRNQYDIVTARAVAGLQILSELCIPFVKVQGVFVAMKGPKYQDEINESKHAFELLGSKLDGVKTYPIDDFERALVVVRKIEPTDPKYPRRYKKIKSKPL